MTNTVTLSTGIGGDGNTYTDGVGDDVTQLGMDGGNHAKWFIPLVSAVVSVANYVAGLAQNMVSAATSHATSTTSLTIGVGSKSLTIQTGKTLFTGQRITTANSSSNAMYGAITSYDSVTGALVVLIDDYVGAGTFTSWEVSVSTGRGNVASTRQLTAAGLVQGGGNLGADRTFNVPEAAAADIRTGTDHTKAITSGAMYDSFAEVTLFQNAGTLVTGSSGGTTLDFSQFLDAGIILGANVTLPTPTNAKAGQRGRIRFTQPAGTTYTISYHSKYKREGGPLALTATVNANDYMEYEVLANGDVLYDLIRNPT